MSVATEAATEVASLAATCTICAMREAPKNSDGGIQRAWAATLVSDRLRVLKRARALMAGRAEEFARAISTELARTQADTLVTELLPLLDACKFLERNAKRLLWPRRYGIAGRPFWLGGVRAEVHREPLGHVLVIGPANFPLFLPGVQVLQALAAGNRVTWKPGDGGGSVAQLMAGVMRDAGLPNGLLEVTGDSVEAGQAALASKPDKVIFTGSANTGRAVLHELAETATPSVMELSGADAVVVLPAADMRTVARAVAFGMRLNGGAVCMSPRRLFGTRATLHALLPLLKDELAKIPAVRLDARTGALLASLVSTAERDGAFISSDGAAVNADLQRPLLVEDATPAMEITRSDIFAPVLSVIGLRSMMELPEAYAVCSYALTAAIFCGKREAGEARAIASILRAGTVLINDLIAPTADPRVPFGGRGASGYGSTRGAEGLLEMTAVKTVLVRRGGTMRHLEPTREEDVPLFAGMIRAAHGGTWQTRMNGLRAVMGSAKRKN